MGSEEGGGVHDGLFPVYYRTMGPGGRSGCIEVEEGGGNTKAATLRIPKTLQVYTHRGG